MKKKKILITGGSGLFGRSILRFLVPKKKYSISLVYNNNKIKTKLSKSFKCDLTKKIEVKKLIKKINPEYIIHFAAFVNPGKNELDKNKSYNENFIITKNIVSASKNKQTTIIFTSTDKVFSGKTINPKEFSDLKPTSAYGKNKLKSEKEIIKNIKKYFILRVPIVHSNGKNPKNLLIDKFLTEIKKNKKIQVFSNLKRSFINLEVIHSIIVNLINQKSFNYGVYNVGSKVSSYYQIVLRLLDINNIKKKKLVSRAKAKNIHPLIQGLNTNKFIKEFSIKKFL